MSRSPRIDAVQIAELARRHAERSETVEGGRVTTDNVDANDAAFLAGHAAGLALPPAIATAFAGVY